MPSPPASRSAPPASSGSRRRAIRSCKITDIAGLARLGHDAGALVVVDNTFASPALQQPLALGADVVVHSRRSTSAATPTSSAAPSCSPTTTRAEKAKFLQFAVGAVSGPLDAWLTTRGIKTLGIRMQRHSENAGAIAEFLSRAWTRSATVYYPGLPEPPGARHRGARRCRRSAGSSRSRSRDAAAARRFAESTRLFQLAESLGGVESLVNYPDEMTHASVRGTELAVPDEVVRLSVGIESGRRPPAGPRRSRSRRSDARHRAARHRRPSAGAARTPRPRLEASPFRSVAAEDNRVVNARSAHLRGAPRATRARRRSRRSPRS